MASARARHQRDELQVDGPELGGPRCAAGGTKMNIMTESGARYAITVDGVARTHRDTREAAFEAANVLKALRPYTKVMIRDLLTGAEIDPKKP
jgi:hypothetical protein